MTLARTLMAFSSVIWLSVAAGTRMSTAHQQQFPGIHGLRSLESHRGFGFRSVLHQCMDINATIIPDGAIGIGHCHDPGSGFVE